jgi:hypothetical protein
VVERAICKKTPYALIWVLYALRFTRKNLFTYLLMQTPKFNRSSLNTFGYESFGHKGKWADITAHTTLLPRNAWQGFIAAAKEKKYA